MTIATQTDAEMESDKHDRSTPQWLLDLFPGFINEWRDHVYADSAYARLKGGMKLEVDKRSWHVDASVSHRRGRLGLGVRYVPHYRITAGAVLGMHDLFMSLCSRGDFFADVPGADGDLATSPHPQRFRDYNLFRGEGGLPIVHNEPSDEVRYALALYLMTAAFHWLIHHEESHFLAGHLLYLEEMHARHAVNEVEMFVGDAKLSADIRALESHADERATLTVARIYGTLPNRLDHPVKEMRTPAQGVRLALVAVGSVLMLFEANRAGPSVSHPMPLTRLLDAFGVVFTTLGQREESIYGPDCADWIDDSTMQWVMDRVLDDLHATSRLLRLSGSVADTVRPLFEGGAAVNRHTEELGEIKQRLSQMRPTLSACQEQVVARTLPGAPLDKW